jgi:hypothetical protein
MAMTGMQRLSVFVSVTWIVLNFAGYLVFDSISDRFRWDAFFLIGVLPVLVFVGVPWGVWWVVAGFRRPRP